MVAFNEIMYRPLTNEAQLEWVEFHRQMAVDVDMSGWSIDGGIQYTFPEGTRMPGGGYLVVAVSPPTNLMAATGLTNVLGPFTGRLSNNGDQLKLYNNNLRLMDEVNYGVEGDWPVGPDGAGVSLAKKDEDAASSPSRNWTVSALAGGTPGRRNFASSPFEITNTTPVLMAATWKYNASGTDLGSTWRQSAYDDTSWSSGQGLFQAGNVLPPVGDPQPVPTAFNTGVGSDGRVLAAGTADPHYQLTRSAQGTPPPPAIQATVMLNNGAWLANDLQSSWIGVVSDGNTGVAVGQYNFRTTFSLEGFDVPSASMNLYVAADNRCTNVFLNGVAKGVNYVGFAAWGGPYAITNSFAATTNTLDFYTVNDPSGANPAGFRADLNVTARRRYAVLTTMPTSRTNYYFRKQFVLNTAPQYAGLTLRTIAADGAVFYLNGTEVLRLNMPAGSVNASTLAVSNVPNPAYVGPFILPTGSLVTGTNILAVEIHQGPDTSNDVLFGSELFLTTTNILIPPPVTLAFNEFSSATNADFWIEVINYGTSNVDLGGCMLARQGGATNREYVFPPQVLAPHALLQVPKATLGFGTDPGDRLFLLSPFRTSLYDAVVAKREPRGRWPDGAGPWWHPTALTPGASNYFVFRNELVLNEIMYYAPGLPAVAAHYETNPLVSITNLWKYNTQGQDLGADWSALDYNDSAWLAGRALFTNGPFALPAPPNTKLPLTNSTSRIFTWYFRAPFVFSGSTNGLQLSLHPLVDAGAVFYLNGAEILRLNMPAGPIVYTNIASTPVSGVRAFSGPFTIPPTNLVIGNNLLAVEIHRFATNNALYDHMAFGAEFSALGGLVPARPAGDSPESWVELFNRSSNPVDLTGWQLAHDIDYSFPAGTTLPAGGYLVVAADVGFMQTNYPGLSVLGPFGGKLRHSSSHLLLLDPAGNPANEVRYYDRKPWPAYADGGGSSIELRDPWADNTKPEAWAASAEGGRSGWNSYSYTMVANNILGPTLWNEFQMGLLDAGECLIDDLHVVESPTSSPVEMLQNGAFESGLTAWRVLGTHAYSRVETDPDNAANHVLHLITRGWTYHIHDHLETTYANSRTVSDGRQYQVSFRAKWLAGNNRLNTRLYFNRVAQTTVMPVPTQHGTPGARNSTYATNVGPTFTALGHSPVVPQPNDLVTVSVSASDPQGVGAVSLWWSANGGAWNTTAMQPSGAGDQPGYTNYAAVLPAQSAGTLVQFFARATDGLGAVSTYPAGGTNSRALFKVDDGTAVMPQLHRLRLLMPAADATSLHQPTNVMSYDKKGTTVIYDERQVFYDAGIHLQSSERGRNDTSRVGFTITLPGDQPFRGVQNTITIDRSGGWGGLGGRHGEILLWHAASHAGGGLLGLNCDLVQCFAPRTIENSTGILRMSAFDGDYFDGQFKNGGDGNLYKLELFYYPTTTVDGNPQSPKLPQPDEVTQVEIQNWGDSKENYRWIFIQENHADQDDYSQIMAVCKAFSLTGTALESQTSQLVDVDEYMRTLAFKAFTGDADTYTAGLNHNFKLYIRPEDGRALGLLWDMDYSFTLGVTAGYPGTGSPTTYNLVMLPNNYRRYCNHLLDLLTTTINSTYLGPWAARYAGLLNQDWSGAVSYLQQRADYIRGTLANPLAAPFLISNNGGNNFATSNSTVTLTGIAPLTVKSIEVNGLSIPVTWTSLSNWFLTVPLPGYTNRLALQGVDSQGNHLAGSVDSIIVTNKGGTSLQPVVINEWMADNAGPGGFPDSRG